MNSKVNDEKKTVAFCKVRGELYAALSLYFSLPSEKMFRDLTADLFSCVDEDLFDASPDFVSIREIFYQLQALTQPGSAKEIREAVDRLNVEYTRLFLVPSDSHIFLYETMYQKSNKLLMGAVAQEVTQIYRDGGLVLHGAFKDLPDHFTVECEYLAHMARREGEAWIQDDPLQAEIYPPSQKTPALAGDECEGGYSCEAVPSRTRRSRIASEGFRPAGVVKGTAGMPAGLHFQKSTSFLYHHLGYWSPQLCALILEQTRADFYRVLASLADKFIAWDIKMRNGVAC